MSSKLWGLIVGNIYIIGWKSIQIILEPIPNHNVEVYWVARSDYFFGTTISWDTTRMLYLQGDKWYYTLDRRKNL